MLFIFLVSIIVGMLGNFVLKGLIDVEYMTYSTFVAVIWIIGSIIRFIVSVLVLRNIVKIQNITLSKWKYLFSGWFISKLSTGRYIWMNLIFIVLLVDKIFMRIIDEAPEDIDGSLTLLLFFAILLLNAYPLYRIGTGVATVFSHPKPKISGWLYFAFYEFYWLFKFVKNPNKYSQQVGEIQGGYNNGQYFQSHNSQINGYVQYHQGMQTGYANGQYVRPQQMSDQQNIYGNQQYAQPQVSEVSVGNVNQQYTQAQRGMQAGYVNPQYQEQVHMNGYVQPQQMGGQQNVYANQDYSQQMQTGYMNQGYPQQAQTNDYAEQYENNQQVNVAQDVNTSNINTESIQTTEEISIFGDKRVDVSRKE